MIRTITSVLALGTITLCLAACGDSTPSAKVTPRKIDPKDQPVPGPDAAADSRHKLGSSTTPPPNVKKP